MPFLSINNSFKNNTNSPITINLPKHKVPKVLTKQVGLANDINFVGRKEELKKVNELLNQNSMLLLLNGIGGIGKSTLASYYLNQKKDELEHYGFVQVNENIKSSFISAFSTSLDLESEKIDDLFAEVMNKLQNLEGKKLLIIDDIKEIDSQLDEMNTIMTLKNSDFKILFTSRETKEYIPQYFLDIMTVEDARELFLKHYNTDEIDKVDKILEYLDYHTFFVEITAQTLKDKSKSLSLDKVIDKFENGEFTVIKRNRQEDFNKYLNRLFANDSILTDNEILLFLKKLSILPSIEVSFEDLYKFLVCTDKEKLEEILIELVNNGWLIKIKDNYKFHQILKEFILENYTPKFEELKNIIEYFTNLMMDIHSTEDVLDRRNYLIYLESLNKLTQKIELNNEEIAYLIHSEGYINFILGNYKKIKKLYDKSLSMRKNSLNENDIQLAISYNGQASLVEKNGNYEDALKLYQKSLEIREKNIWIEKIVIEYNNIGRMYKKIGKYDEAFKYLVKSLNIRKEVFGEEHESTAKAYNVLGSYYQDISKDKSNNIINKKNHNKAYDYLYKSLEIRKKALKDNHPSIATSYNNIATWYSEIENHEKAIEYLNNIINNFSGKENQEIIALASFNLGQNYLITKEYKYGKTAIKNALNIWNNIFPENHPYIKQCEKILLK